MIKAVFCGACAPEIQPFQLLFNCPSASPSLHAMRRMEWAGVIFLAHLGLVPVKVHDALIKFGWDRYFLGRTNNPLLSQNSYWSSSY